VLISVIPLDDQGKGTKKKKDYDHPQQSVNAEAIVFHIEVEDTGIGVDANLGAQLFQPYTQGNTQSKYEGIGLGLSISKILTEALRGKIGMSSIPGKGSKFWVDIPLKVLPMDFPAFSPLSTINSTKEKAKMLVGIYSQGRSLKIQQNYLSVWGIPYIVLGNQFAANQEVNQQATHLIIDHPASQVLFVPPDRHDITHSPEDFCGLPCFMMCTLHSFRSYNRFVQEHNLMDLMTLVIKPFPPIKLHEWLSKTFFSPKEAQFISPSIIPTPSVSQSSLPSKFVSSSSSSSYSSTEFANLSLQTLGPESDLSLYASALQVNRTTPPKVLVVEDNPICQMVIGKQLEKLDVSFDISASGLEALKLWEASWETISLIFMDIHIEGPLNGFQVCSIIREKEKSKFRESGKQSNRVFIAILTGRDLEETADSPHDWDTFLTKPISLDLLSNLVQQQVNNSNN